MVALPSAYLSDPCVSLSFTGAPGYRLRNATTGLGSLHKNKHQPRHLTPMYVSAGQTKSDPENPTTRPGVGGMVVNIATQVSGFVVSQGHKLQPRGFHRDDLLRSS